MKKLLRKSATAVNRVVYHSDPLSCHSKFSNASACVRDTSKGTSKNPYKNSDSTSITNTNRKLWSYPSNYELLSKKGITEAQLCFSFKVKFSFILVSFLQLKSKTHTEIFIFFLLKEKTDLEGIRNNLRDELSSITQLLLGKLVDAIYFTHKNTVHDFRRTCLARAVSNRAGQPL